MNYIYREDKNNRNHSLPFHIPHLPPLPYFINLFNFIILLFDVTTIYKSFAILLRPKIKQQQKFTWIVTNWTLQKFIFQFVSIDKM